MTTNLFVLSTGFHYYFSTLLIESLQLDDVKYAMFQPREGIEQRAAADYPVAFADRMDFTTRHFGKKLGKRRFAHRAFRELALAGHDVRMYSPYYNESFIYVLRRLLERHCRSVEYNMIPDGISMLRHLPGVPKFKRLPSWLRHRLYGVEPTSMQHKSGSYSSFLTRIYHFPASTINADQSKLEIIALPEAKNSHNGEVLVLGGLRGISREFVMSAKAKAEGRRVKYRMHPKIRRGHEFIETLASDWVELGLDCVLEEHLLASPYYKVIGCYSSAVVFNHLFVQDSQTEIVVEAANEDPDYHTTADACGIPVTLV